MERVRSDQVVLIVDQRDPRSPPIETELQGRTPGELKPPNPMRAKMLNRLSFSKPKARFLEYNQYPLVNAPKVIPESNDIQLPLDDYSSTDDEDDELNEGFDEDDGEMGRESKYRLKTKKFNWRLLAEWILLVIIMACLMCSLTIKSVKAKRTWGLEIWKWCLMVLVTFCGRLVSGWVMSVAVFLIERNFMLREKVLYFVYGLRKSIQNCIWLGLVLLAWTFMFDSRVHRENKVLKKVFQALIAVLLGATIWVIKIVLVKMLASTFHVAAFFDRMKESVFHHYILDTLSGPPMAERTDEQTKNYNKLAGSKTLPSNWKEGEWKQARNNFKSKKLGSRKIDMDRLRQLSMETSASAWSVKRLVTYVMSSGLTTISNTVDDFGKAESESHSEWEARNCTRRIFRNVAKPGAK